MRLEAKRKIHIAIMHKNWGLTEKILTGEKTIESRWYQNRSRPWNQIKINDIIYFKNSSEPVKIKAKVQKVLQFENLNPEKIREILFRFSQTDGLGVQPQDIEKYFRLFQNKKYCLIIFLKNVRQVKPFDIDKSGFGSMAAWITVNSLKKIKKSPQS